MPVSVDQIGAEQYLGWTEMNGVIWVNPEQAGRTSDEMGPTVHTAPGKFVAFDIGDWIHRYVDWFEVAKPIRYCS
ncbi:MAG: hypothetical protein F9K19_17275 [Rhizobiaceae bacterium]|nr:MAG: hypothetical protein F9K19_17275 [Rhizobiaceae bacterium]CAG0972340.1 hypothetical protein RHIZO_01286 [Rhizobiaceae bacterium]